MPPKPIKIRARSASDSSFTSLHLAWPHVPQIASPLSAQAGYTIENWEVLANDIRDQILSAKATPIEKTEYGQMYEIRRNLIGPNGESLPVCTIWLTETTTGNTKFITMYPDRRR